MAEKKRNWMTKTCETCIFRNGGTRCYYGPPNEKADNYKDAAYYTQIADIERGQGVAKDTYTYISACSKWESFE